MSTGDLVKDCTTAVAHSKCSIVNDSVSLLREQANGTDNVSSKFSQSHTGKTSVKQAYISDMSVNGTAAQRVMTEQVNGTDNASTVSP